MPHDSRVAVLIDADNVSSKYIKIILDEISKEDGVATYKRIYGDWTNPALVSWKNVLLDNSVLPVQQYSYTTGKNSTDSAMIIDAMDILYSGKVDGFCLVSSDSDFTRLAARLRESGMTVLGMGESKTPSSFISACNQFKYLDILAANEEEEGEEPVKASRNTGLLKRRKHRKKENPSALRSRAPACAPCAGPCARLSGKTPMRTTGFSSERWAISWANAIPTLTCGTLAFPSLPPSWTPWICLR